MANKKDYNPRNPKNTLYRKLTRLLSGPLADNSNQDSSKGDS